MGIYIICMCGFKKMNIKPEIETTFISVENLQKAEAMAQQLGEKCLKERGYAFVHCVAQPQDKNRLRILLDDRCETVIGQTRTGWQAAIGYKDGKSMN